MGMATQAYLVAYNAGCLAGWGFALFTALSVVAAGDGDAFSRLGGVWAASGQTVLYVQYAMALEIFHAAFGLVRSPLLTTALQVTSRLWVVLLPVAGAPCDVGAGWATGLMVLSWSTVEVIRYAFYLSALLLPKVPYPIFWARYTAFAILYPSGITGELGTAFAALECAAVAPYHSAIWCIVYMRARRAGRRGRGGDLAEETDRGGDAAATLTFRGGGPKRRRETGRDAAAAATRQVRGETSQRRGGGDASSPRRDVAATPRRLVRGGGSRRRQRG